MCDSHLLHTLASQARTLLITEEKAASSLEGLCLYSISTSWDAVKLQADVTSLYYEIVVRVQASIVFWSGLPFLETIL
jgi:hypothetical protein